MSSVSVAEPTAKHAAPSTKPEPVVVPLHWKLVVGGISGIVGTTIVFPLDMVKTRLQGQTTAAGAVARYSGPVDCFKKIIRAEGWRGLYGGLKPNLIGVAPEKALKLTANDVFREAFTRRNGNGKITLFQEMLSGALAGFIQVAVTNPMEIVKLRMQLQGEKGAHLSTSQTVKNLGLRGLYKGTAATWLRDIPFSIVFFPMFANLNILFNGEQSMLGLFTAGVVAGSVSAGMVTPLDVVKTRLQQEGNQFKGIMDAARNIYRTEGLAAFRRGLEPRMVVQAPLFGITLFAFETQKRWIAKNNAKKQQQI